MADTAPIRLRRDGDYATDVYAGKGKESQCVAVIVQASTRNIHEAEANAAFIVRACNCHEELVGALERISQDDRTPSSIAHIALAAIEKTRIAK